MIKDNNLNIGYVWKVITSLQRVGWDENREITVIDEELAE
jgi:hypothetical protein